VVDTLLPGRVSLPVHGPDGWYLVQVNELWTTPIMTQTEEARSRKNVQDALVKRTADSLSDAYVRRIMEEHTPTILREPFNAIVASIGKRLLTKEQYEAWELGSKPGASNVRNGSTLERMTSDTLVLMKNGKILVGQFVEWYRMREPYFRVRLTSPQSFVRSVEELVWRMIRDHLLTQRAYAKGFQKRTTVRRQAQWWHEKMLYLANKHRIADAITDSLPILRKYYEAHRQEFSDEKGIAKSFEQARDDVWRQYHAEELRKRLLHEILRLKREYGVTVDDKALMNLVVDAENDPRAIDVYPAKTGGIYPRQAFPSIDYEWQTWN
jgi:hypothetical protein